MLLYHGTNMDNALAILGKNRDGFFGAGTWFGSALEVALIFGGEWVFCVFLDPTPGWARMDGVTDCGERQWQCRNPEPLPSYGNVIWLRMFSSELLVWGDVANERLRAHHQRIVNPGRTMCVDCSGHGEVGPGFDGFMRDCYVRRSIPRPHTEICGRCGGYGALGVKEEMDAGLVRRR